MTFQQLQYVSEVAHLGSINKASQKLFISQSSVSNTIKALETELTRLIPISDYGEDMRLGWVKLKHKFLSEEAMRFLELFQDVLFRWQAGTLHSGSEAAPPL